MVFQGKTYTRVNYARLKKTDLSGYITSLMELSSYLKFTGAENLRRVDKQLNKDFMFKTQEDRNGVQMVLLITFKNFELKHSQDAKSVK